MLKAAGEGAAHGVAADRRLRGRRAEPLGVGAAPVIGGQHVLQPLREPVLGRQAIVHREHRPSARRRQQRAERVGGLEVADHAAAHVRPDHQRRLGILAGRPVEPGADVAARARQDDRLPAHAGLRASGDQAEALGVDPPRLLGRQAGDRRRPAGLRGHVLQARVQGAAALIDHAAARHQPQHRRGQAEQGLQDQAL